ncbi:MAG: xanthine dehydrogenase family protein molybdopterin-binding subunit [Anaerolineae bacterium]|jgi:CO/xanthine dehydrogenase Mo-binding subunit|nr:xanthine dehydrogenase family protein molybdopterin-binding subunit [Anaerolineae bacterium]
MPKQTTFAIGESIKRIDAHGKVTGETPYPADLDREGQLWMKLRFSDRAHARVLTIDTTQAESLSGVVAIFTAKDIPANEYGLVTKDQPVLCGPGSANPYADIVRCYMDCIAVVVAEDPETAAAAAHLIQVRYEDLPTVFDMEAALSEGAPLVQENTPNNTLCRYRIRKGDVEAAFQSADVIIEGEYRTGYQEHAFLQPESGLAYLDDQDRITVVVAGQWVHEDLWQITHALDLPEDRVRVIYPAIGGAFGGREDMSVQIVLALAVMKLRRPVKIVWSREESILYHHKRHPFLIRTKWGAKQDGTITAIQATVMGDAGAYNYTSTKVIANACLMVSGPYQVENVYVDAYGVLTNNIPTGAFRGFGAPQAALAAESQVNKLALALGIDPVTIRLKNAIREGSILSVGTPLPPGVSMPEVLEAGGRESFWHFDGSNWQQQPLTQPTDPALRRGIGFACGYKNVGFAFGFPEHSWARIELQGDVEIQKVKVWHAGADVGQGAHTAFLQMTAEAVGVPVEQVEVIAQDTADTQSSGSASASRLTFMAGNAIRGAAELALKAWQHEERPAVAEFMYRPPKTTMYDPQTGKSEPNFAYGYAAQAVELEIDIETGLLRLIQVVSTHDVGKVINPIMLEGQVEGAIVQAQGYAIMENLISVNGKILNPYLSTYLIPTVLDVPDVVKTVILEYPDPIGPWGARGMAEMPFLALAPAITAAIHYATGVWIDEIPLTPDKVVKALRAHGVGSIR